jgi:GntR family transcriptional regulator
MLLRVQRGSATPISRQIENQVRAQILSGTLEANTRLPSVRQLASELAVNVNTVVRVYERLASEGLIDVRQGDGSFVAATRKTAHRSELSKERKDYITEVEALVQRGRMLGLSREDLVDLFTDAAARTANQASPPKTSQSAKEISS